MNIISVPHPTLRTTAKKIEQVDKKLINFITNLSTTLEATRNPKGVGLAAPQVDKQLRVFATNLSRSPRIFINPTIEKHSKKLTLGDQPDDPILEGCLSIPHLWGPVPRWEWIEASFDVLDGQSLTRKIERFFGYGARVFQHELDHLDGILFTDHSLQYDLPVYQQTEKNSAYTPVARSILEAY